MELTLTTNPESEATAPAKAGLLGLIGMLVAAYFIIKWVIKD